MKDMFLCATVALVALWWLEFYNEAVSFVSHSESIVVLTKGGTNKENYVAVYSSSLKNFDLAASNCQQVLDMYKTLYTDGDKFSCHRIK